MKTPMSLKALQRRIGATDPLYVSLARLIGVAEALKKQGGVELAAANEIHDVVRSIVVELEIEEGSRKGARP